MGCSINDLTFLSLTNDFTALEFFASPAIFGADVAFFIGMVDPSNLTGCFCIIWILSHAYHKFEKSVILR
jgi:hypothetical protein